MSSEIANVIFGLNPWEATKSVAAAFIPWEDTIGQRSNIDQFQESTYGRPIPIIYGEYNRLAGNVIYFEPIAETRNQIKHTNGTFGSSTYTVWYTYSIPVVAIAIGGPITNIRRIWANKKLLLTNDFATSIPDNGLSYNPSGSPYSGIYMYNGSDTQIRSHVIPDTTKPGYQGISYIVFTGLQLADFNNSLPNFEFEIDGGLWNLAEVIRDICLRTGMTSDEFEVDQNLTQYTIIGFVVSNSSTAEAALMSLSEVYPFDIIETPDRIYFKERAAGLYAAIDNEEMGASQNRSKTSSPLQTMRKPDFDFSRNVSVTYIDPHRDFQKSTQYASRGLGNSYSKIEKNFEITLEADDARRIADRLLWEPWSERLRGSFRTSLRYDALIPGDYIGIKVGDSWLPFKIERKTRGANHVIDFDVVSGDPYAYDGSTISESANPNTNPELGESEMFVYLFNAPYIEVGGQDASANWVSNASTGAWRGGNLYRSTDGGETYQDSGLTTSRNITGVLQNTLGSANHFFWDRENVIDVILDYSGHTLNSTSEINVLNGANRIWVGHNNGNSGEIIGFRTATLISSNPRRYQLSNLLRGRRATENFISNHGANERFVFLSNQEIKSINYGFGDRGYGWRYKAVPTYFTEPSITDYTTFINTCERSRPRPPVHARGSRDASNNLTITWFRRTRLFSPGLGNGEVLLDEATENYQIDIYNNSNTSVVRTISVSGATTATYSAADQTTDGYTPGANINIRIFQISTNTGRGRGGVFTA